MRARSPGRSIITPRRPIPPGTHPDRIRRVDNPLLELDFLPAFDRIAARHAAPALRQVLAENRARLEELTAQSAPTFASLVVPVEELGYRLSRVWSPVGHLNAVANSADMRAAYNECLPLLTEYSSELGQNAALKRGYAAGAGQRGSAAGSPAAQGRGKCAARFPARRRRPAGGPQARFREIMQELAQLATSSPRTCWIPHAPTPASVGPGPARRAALQRRGSRGCRCAEANRSGWLFKLDQPTYMTIMTSADDGGLRRDIYEAWVTRASEIGPSAGRFDNNPLIARILPLRHEAATLLGFDNFAQFALATRMAKSADQVLEFLRIWRGAAGRPQSASSPTSRPSPAAGSRPGTSRITPRSSRRAVSRSPRRSCGRISRCRRCCPGCSP